METMEEFLPTAVIQYMLENPILLEYISTFLHPQMWTSETWFTYSRGWCKLLGKALHLCCVDLVVKVNKIAPLLLPRSWIMC